MKIASVHNCSQMILFELVPPSNFLSVGAVGLIGLTMLPRCWKRVAPTEKYRDASAGCFEMPSVAITILFLLILTGPPRLRDRDPMASIRGDVDVVVILHIAVWALAGMWVFDELSRNRSRLHSPIRLPLPQRLGILFVSCLGLSALVSDAPLLTLFEVYQLGVMLLFAFFFVRRYGPRACLQRLFWGYTVLLIAAGILALCAPDVAFESMPSGGLRLWAKIIARGGVGQVAALAIVLLLTIAPQLPRILYLPLLGLDVTILVVSYTRSAYLCLFAFLALALVKRAQSVAPRRVAYLILAAVPLLLATGLLGRIIPVVARETESLGDLTGRAGLWTYLANVTFTKSPWIGLGYYSAARIYGLQYAEWSGIAHSSFMGVFVGGGLLSLGLFALLWSILLSSATSLLLHTTERYAFAACSLLISVFVASQVGEGMEPGATGFTFWCLLAIVPWMRDRLRSSRNSTVCEQQERGIGCF